LSILTIAWSMCAAASFMLALLHLLLWFNDRRAHVYLLSVLMAVSAGAGALTELALMHAGSIDTYRRLIQWENLFVYTLLLPMVWFVRARLPVARRWLAIVISILWSVAILVNWLSPYSLVYAEIASLRQMPTFWGEQFSLASGPANPWVHLANLASVLIVIYVIDAGVRSWRAGDRRRSVQVAGSVATFIVLGGIHTPLVDAGVVETPYMISFAFLAIVVALSYELVSDAVLASRYAKEIRASEARWRSLLTDVQLAVIGVDPKGRINYANPFFEQLIEYRTEDLIGRPVVSLLPELDRGALTKRLAAAAQTGPRPHSRSDLVCASGVRRSLAWSSVRLNDADGRYAGLLSIGEDITERLAAERNLERTRRELERLGRANMLGELVSTLAHELNQPLAAILSNAQAARRIMGFGTPDPEELREILDDIVRDDKRAGEVIQRLRLMLSKGTVERERFQIRDAIGEVLAMAGAELETWGVAVSQEQAADLPALDADRVEIQQVIMNLLVNAAHAVSSSPPERRRVRIQAGRRGGDHLQISIEDTGPGIPADALPRLFEPFFTTKSHGLGMGLAICRRIVEAHGGQIRGENTGNGARFSFTVPLVEPDESHV
jgi:two-component system sensor kinase FixL